VVLILCVGIAYGAWRVYQQRFGGRAVPGFGSAPGGQANSRAGGGGVFSAPATTDASGGVSFVLITSATKKDWLQGQIERFNDANRGKYAIQPHFIETREAMHAILGGKEQPVLWSPSSPIWAVRLGEAYEQEKNESIVDVTDSDSYRVYLRSPIVFLTTSDKATFLRPLLSGPEAWANIRDLGSGRKKAPWGRFKYAHADPITANSGFLTLAMMLLDYSRRTGGDATGKTATSAGFINYLKGVEKPLVFDQPAKQGSSPLAKAFADDPTRYDVITTYESTALGLLATNPDLAVIYPDPTVVAEQSVLVVNGPWVTPEQRDGAKKFLAFLGGQESLQDGLTNHFRTSQSSGSLSLAPELSRQSKRGFKQSFTSVEMPNYAALNDAACQWRQSIAGLPCE
jgi:hypothetical protein